MHKLGKMIGPMTILGFSVLALRLSLPLSFSNRIYPQVLASTLLGLSVLLVGREVRMRNAVAARNNGDETELQATRLWAFAFLLACYVLSWDYVGYWITTTIYIAISLVVLGERSPYILVILPIATTVVICLVFVHFLHVPLPKGTLS